MTHRPVIRTLSLIIAAVLLLSLGTAVGAEDPKTNAMDGVSAASAVDPELTNAAPGVEALSDDTIVGEVSPEDLFPEAVKHIYINVPAAAFINDGWNDREDWFNSFAGGYILGKKNGSVCFSAPFYPLPGTTIASLEGWFRDNTSDQAYLRMYNRRVTTNVVTEMGRILTGNNTAVVRYTDATIVDGVMNNNNAYYLGTCIYKDQRFYGARVHMIK